MSPAPLPWDHPDNIDADGRRRYGSRGPMPCANPECGHDVVRHLSAVEGSGCTLCACRYFHEDESS